ncbi:MAG: hypothetical protein M3Q97_11840, partial [Bacteroidota bacterium]|nr:hypothetical protein [Bacteroidota bacterium]
MYEKKQLGTQSYDLYKLLLPEIAGSSTGGDAVMERMRKRTNPVQANRYKLLSYWSGILKPDANGIVKVKLPIPQFNGEVRLMAVAYSGKKFGSAETRMKVSNDVIVMPAVPRFLSQNDALTIPVTVMNTTGRSGSFTLKLSVQGPISITSESQQTVTLEANGQKQVVFKVKTGEAIGAANLKFTGSGLDIMTEEIELAVRPVSPFVVETGAGIIKAGQSVSLDFPGDFVQSSRPTTTLAISKFPALQYATQLKRLLRYPYGCLEQTVSKAFPLLYFGELAALAAPESFKTNGHVFFVKEAIRKVESMQQHNGALSFWAGEPYYNWWSMVYAAHFLLEAKKAGYGVDQAKLNNLLNFIKTRSTDRRINTTYRYDGYGYVEEKLASREIIYSLYVLALANKGDISLMNYYRSRPELLGTDMTYMLAGAYALMGKWSDYHDIIPKTFTAYLPQRKTGDDFNSEIRANAIMLDVLLEAEPGNSQIPSLVNYLARQADRMHTTQEMAWGFMALGKAAKANANSNVTVNITSEGKSVAAYNNKEMKHQSSTLPGKSVQLRATGTGSAYYFWTIEGVKQNAKVQEADNMLKVRRQYYDRFGNVLRGFAFSQGQLIVCRISLTTMNQSVENIAISDLIPAGFEIVNPRLGESGKMSWIPDKDRMAVQNLDIRDDRLLVFTSLSANKEVYYYY